MSSSKRATIPSQTFSKTATALDKLTGRGSSSDQSPEQTNQDESINKAPSEEQLDGNTVSQYNGITVKPLDGNTVKAVEKTSFYLRPDQVDKLDELVMAYKRRTGKRGVNRNDIVRHLIDRCELESLLTEDGTGTL
jgi:hypothetical protein